MKVSHNEGVLAANFHATAIIVSPNSFGGGTSKEEQGTSTKGTLVAKLLIMKGADVNAKSNGSTPLQLAAESGYKEMTDILLTNKADINAKNNEGKTPLGVALSYDKKDEAELLRQHGGHE
jgi:ankyrin repeat protein